jgi:hypothetical protein
MKSDKDVPMVKVEIENIVLNISTNAPIVILRDARGRVLPIVIGIFEAQAILLVLEKTKFARPLTHDLILNIFRELNAVIEKLEIHSLRENTYFADLVVRMDREMFRVDCRPSDGIALALRASAPIFACEKLLEPAEIIRYYEGKEYVKSKDPERPIDQKETEEFRKMLEKLNARDFWKQLKEDES